MKQIEKLYNEWKSLQPVPGEVQAKIDQKFMLEFNYNSNHIEGNTLTYGQTELLLMFGQVDGDAKMHDLEEMKAHNVGLKMMQEEALATERHMSEYFIKTLHQTLIREDYNVRKELPDGSVATYTVHAGQYKSRPNSVITATGERFEYASPEETPALMTDLIDWYNGAVDEGKLSALELASLFHYRYIRIHPFEDGNGRIARLLVNFILLRADYPMIIVRSDDKDKYLSALNRCDVVVGLNPSDGAHAELEQIQPFVEYMRGCLARALEIRIRAAQGESIEEEDDWKKKMVILSKRAQDCPPRTKELINKVLQEEFLDFHNAIIDALAPFRDMFFSAKHIIYVAPKYSQGYTIKHFSDMLQNNFADAIRSTFLFQISQSLRAYDIQITINYKFKEFEYEVTIDTGKNKNIQTVAQRYGRRLSDKQTSAFISCIGRHIAQVYEQYVQDDKH